MEFISSDTNVWLDFLAIDRLNLPFLLPYTYIMNVDSVDDELVSPKGLGDILKSYGLLTVELSEEEFYLAEEYVQKYI